MDLLLQTSSDRLSFVEQTHPVAAKDLADPALGISLPHESRGDVRVPGGVEIAEVTLDVGLGTFEPIRSESLEEHKIHVESYEIPEAAGEAIIRAKREQRPILAVGTTVVRALEDAAQKAGGTNTLLRAGKFEASIFLFPGKPFRVVDQLLTNFHLPRSSLLALVAAFAGLENTLAAYRHAVDAGYRFYSYGDCMLIR